MRLERVVRPLGYCLIGVFLVVMAGRAPMFAGDGGPYVLQHDIRQDPARDLIRAVRDAVKRLRGAAAGKARDVRLKAARISAADGGQTP